MSLQAYTALHRFGLGAAPGDTAVVARDPSGWLLAQLNSRPAAVTYDLPDTSSLVVQLRDIKKGLKEAKKTDEADSKEMKHIRQDIVLKSQRARFMQNLNAPDPFIERLVLFWSNFFTVSMKSKLAVAPTAAAFERDAIRPHVLGSFEEMLVAVTKHPAMLMYLDNQISVGPNSRVGQKRDAGLNENLARETLELHSLGVDGGYTQKDVVALANVITGWTVGALRADISKHFPPDAYGFSFAPVMHEPGSQSVMGKNYAQSGMDQGLAVLHDLAHYPATAKYVAKRMLLHFVSDTPSPQDITWLAQVFQSSGGNLREMAATLVQMPAAWEKPLSKVKTPYELVISVLKVLQIPAAQIPSEKIYGSLKAMDHVPFNAPSPAGWGDTADDWMSGNSLMTRIEWCHALSQLVGSGVDASALAQDVLNGVITPTTLSSISRAPSGVDGLALLFASPEFQRR
ncbi:MAG: DUF1800 domain-containing protein [Pseudobdellovibrionaceae bacterium]